MSDQNYPPTLEIPETLSDDIVDGNITWVQGSLNFNDPKEIDGKFGKRYMYSINVPNDQGADVKHTLFASPALHKEIQQTGGKSGTVIKIFKERTGPADTNIKWHARWVIGERRDPPTQQAQQAPQQQASGGTPSTTAPQQQATTAPPQDQQPYGVKVYNQLGDDEVAVYEEMIGDAAKMRRLAVEAHVIEFQEQLNDGSITMEQVVDMAIGADTRINIDLQRSGGIRSYRTVSQVAESIAAVDGPPAPEADKSKPLDVPLPDCPIEERVAYIKSLSYDQPKGLAEFVLREIAKLDTNVKSWKHAGPIVKGRLGYASIPNDPEIWGSMAEEVYVYQAARDEGKTSLEAIEVVSKWTGRPEDVMVQAYEASEAAKNGS